MQYKLVDGLVISSKYFTKGIEFPIIIALYKKGSMDFDHIKNFNFKTENGHCFKCLYRGRLIEIQLFSMLRRAKNLDKHNRLARLKMV